MKVQVSAKPVHLTKSDFIAQGGEGSVYAKGGTAYKIYTDISKMIPEAKIRELSVLTDPCIIKPDKVIYNNKKKPIGYTMRHLTKTESLCRIFTKSFKNRHNIDHNTIFSMVQRMQQGVQHVHDNNILIVDVNELNFLMSDSFDEVYFIDVDSYQTPNFAATAIMPSIQDRHTPVGKFNVGSDWFSWGILTFQMFIGIHPYKGKHPTVKDMDARMLQNLSVFNDNVSVPKVCYPLDVIPQAYRDWYEAIFEKGVRVPPPTSAVGVVAIPIITKVDHIKGSDKFDMTELEEFKQDIVQCYHWNGSRVVLMLDEISIDNKVFPAEAGTAVGRTQQLSNIIGASTHRGRLQLTNYTTGRPIAEELAAEGVMSYDGRLYIKQRDKIQEIEFMEMPTRIRAAAKLVANVLPQATKIFDGVVIQNLLDSLYVSVFPNSGVHRQIRIKELEDARIVDAKFENNVLMIVAYANSTYNRYVMRFSDDFLSYDFRTDKDIVHNALNFTVLDNGICVHIDDESKVNIFRNKKDDQRMTVVEDDAIESDMMLFKHGAEAVFAKGKKLYKLKMK